MGLLGSLPIVGGLAKAVGLDSDDKKEEKKTAQPAENKQQPLDPQKDIQG